MTADAHRETVVAEGLTKRFGATRALNDVSFAVARAELFGFVGPDGGGKTTLFRILATLMVPDGGRARVLGRDVVTGLWELRPRIGYMPGRFSLYPDLSVEENLRFFASVFGTSMTRERGQIAPIYRQLEPFKHRRAAALSGGMKQKLALCCALVHRPEILFLDEPTTGVDAVSRREFWDLLAQFKASGMTIVVSTPYMDEANRCDRVALIQGGRLLAVDAPKRIAESFGRPLLSIAVGEARVGHGGEQYRALLALRGLSNTLSVYPFGETLHYADARTDVEAATVVSDVKAALEKNGFTGARVGLTPPTVEDAFMARMAAPEGAHAA